MAKTSSPFIRQGTCNSCRGKALCCQNMLLGFNGKNIRSLEQLEQLIAKDSRNKVWEKTRETESGDWVFSCRNLLHNGKCLDYKNRPTNCRKFPSPLDVIPTLCSFQFSLNSATTNSLSVFGLKALLTETKQYGLIQAIHELVRKRT